MTRSRGYRRRRRERERRACTDKVAYPSELAALRVAARIGLNWYRCPYCHKWHLTHRARWKPRRREG